MFKQLKTFTTYIFLLFAATLIISCDSEINNSNVSLDANSLKSKNATNQSVITELSDFETNFGGWDYSPKFIGGGKTPGWELVSNDYEKAVKCNPTATKQTYYWKLTKKFDLTDATTAQLNLKFLFSGHKYSFFKISIGSEAAQSLSDFTTLKEFENGTTTPQETEIDLNNYIGKNITIQLLLKKPYSVVEKKIGLYIHKIELLKSVKNIPLDITAPEMISIKTNTKSINGAGTISVEMKVKESGSGIASATLYSDSPSRLINHSQGHNILTALYVDLQNSNPESGIYTLKGDIDIKTYHESGTWKLRYIILTDNVGIIKNYQANEETPDSHYITWDPQTSSHFNTNINTVTFDVF